MNLCPLAVIFQVTFTFLLLFFKSTSCTLKARRDWNWVICICSLTCCKAVIHSSPPCPLLGQIFVMENALRVNSLYLNPGQRTVDSDCPWASVKVVKQVFLLLICYLSPTEPYFQCCVLKLLGSTFTLMLKYYVLHGLCPQWQMS